MRGWAQASQALEYASSRFRVGKVTAFEEVARYAGADLVVIHETEQWQAKVGGAEELSQFRLRVTSTFRPEDGGWPQAKALHDQHVCIVGQMLSHPPGMRCRT